jgi:sugar phosphate isomerase/epimerase
MINIACQTIVFGNPLIKDHIAEIAAAVKKIGYDGAEIGARHFYQERLEYYRELFNKIDLKLMALHAGGDFLNKDSVREQLENVKGIISFARALECPYLYLSGTFREAKTQDDYIIEAESYREIGRMFIYQCIILCYHNHNWEFLGNGEGMGILLDQIPPELMKLVPDAGWLEVAGVSALGFLKENISRIEAVHFKDFKGPGQFAELGTGIVPFEEIYAYLAGIDRDWWISAEQDETSLKPEEAARLNYQYIAGLGK